MLKSCKYCGGIHDRKHICASKPNDTRVRDSEADRFRNTNAWKIKRKYIQERDNYLCQVCIRNLHHTFNQYSTDTQVHHIVPINEDYELRLENDNLISLCRMHHEAAEAGDILKHVLVKIVDEQVKKNAI
jgi:5-methylcytosine-specific restriction enzyme A